MPEEAKGPSKEEQAKKWLATLEAWKERRRGPGGAGSGKLKNDLLLANQKINAIEAQLREASMKSARLEAEAKTKEEEANRLKQEAAGKDAMLAQLQGQAARLRQDFSARLVSLEKEIEEKNKSQSRESEEIRSHTAKVERELSEKERALHASEERYQEAVVRIQSLTNQLADKSRELEDLSRSLGRYQSGAIEKTMGGQIHELDKSLAEVSATLASKEKELSDFKEFLKSQEKQMHETMERQAQENAQAVNVLQEQLRLQKTHSEGLEGELSSFRNLLRREEERTRRQDAVFRQLEEERKVLIKRLASMGADIKEYHERISRHLEPEGGLGAAQPASTRTGAAMPLGLGDLGVEDVLDTGGEAQEMMDAEIEAAKEDIRLEGGDDFGDV